MCTYSSDGATAIRSSLLLWSVFTGANLIGEMISFQLSELSTIRYPVRGMAPPRRLHCLTSSVLRECSLVVEVADCGSQQGLLASRHLPAPSDPLDTQIRLPIHRARFCSSSLLRAIKSELWNGNYLRLHHMNIHKFDLRWVGESLTHQVTYG